MAIDRQRGALIRKYGSGARCVMYYDEPGVYYDENGNKLSKEIAKQAGFDVAADTQAAARSRVKSRTERQLQLKFAEAEQRIGEMSAQEIAGIGIVEHGGNDRYALVDSEGNMICQIIFSYEEAVEFYEAVTGNEYVTPAGSPRTSETVTANSPFSPVGTSLLEYLEELEIDVPDGASVPELVQIADEQVTVPKLKKYLTDHEVEFAKNARKDDLIAATVAYLAEDDEDADDFL